MPPKVHFALYKASRSMGPLALVIVVELITGVASVWPSSQFDGVCAEPEPFVEFSETAGLDFVHFAGATGKFYFPEIAGSGGALFDFDGDGDLDLYAVQGGLVNSRDSVDQAIFKPPYLFPLSDRLYRNDQSFDKDGLVKVRFVDVSSTSGILAGGYGMGATVGDFDRDGWLDLYVTNFGSNRLLRNRGDGSFEDVTKTAGVDDSRWSVGATFFDFDNDGWLDLYVGNYVDFSVSKQVPCFANSGLRDYCGPTSYPPLPDRLFRNSGNGTFQEVTGVSGLGSETGAALGVLAADFDGDNLVDVYVGNDGGYNFLWMNQGNGTFRNEALYRGCAVNAEGKPEASMGVDFADFDSDGDEDLLVTHLKRETNTLYLNDGGGLFKDGSSVSGLGPPSWKHTGFGTGWFDYNNDGRVDLFVANGAVKGINEIALQHDTYPFHERNQLFCNSGEDGLIEVDGGLALQRSEVSRGAMFGDVDNDGDTDIVVANNNGPLRLLLNRTGQLRGWFGARPVGSDLSVEKTGTRVSVMSERGMVMHKRVHRDGSYASANDPRSLFGLGIIKGKLDVEVTWSTGNRQKMLSVPANHYLTFVDSAETGTR